MCTLVAWIGVFPEAPLVVAANRDENLGRASAGPRLHEGPVKFVAPVDLVAGGSWWAVNARGLFVGLTNRAGAMRSDLRRSRGHLVTDVAKCGSLDEAETLLEQLGPDAYNGFHLLVTDGVRGVRVVADGLTKELTEVGRGLHVVTERGFGAAPHSRDGRVYELFGKIHEPAISQLKAALSSHADPPIDALCVHVPEADYGTRSSSIYLRPKVGDSTLLYAPGPPCSAAYEDLSALLRRW